MPAATVRQSHMLATSRVDTQSLVSSPVSSGIVTQLTSQPQVPVGIDWSNPIARGLLSAIDKNGVDVVQRRLPSQITVPTSPTAIGSGLKFAAASEVAKCADFQPDITTFTTFDLVVPNFSSSSNTRMGIYHYQASAGSIQNRLRLVWLDSSNGFYADTNGGFAAKSVPSFSAGRPLSILLSKIAFNNGFYMFNGVKASPTWLGSSDSGGPAIVPTWIGDDVEASSGRRFDGVFLLHLYFNRALSEAESASLSANPWQIFAPAKRKLITGVA